MPLDPLNAQIKVRAGTEYELKKFFSMMLFKLFPWVRQLKAMVTSRSSRKRDLVGGRVPKRHLKLGYTIYLTEGTLVREFDFCRTTVLVLSSLTLQQFT